MGHGSPEHALPDRHKQSRLLQHCTYSHFLPKNDMMLRWPGSAPAPLSFAPPTLPFAPAPLPEPPPPLFAARFPPFAGEGDWEGTAGAKLLPPAAEPAAPLPAAAWLPGALAPPAALCAPAAGISKSVNGKSCIHVADLKLRARYSAPYAHCAMMQCMPKHGSNSEYVINILWFFRRADDSGASLGADGVCERGRGLGAAGAIVLPHGLGDLLAVVADHCALHAPALRTCTPPRYGSGKRGSGFALLGFTRLRYARARRRSTGRGIVALLLPGEAEILRQIKFSLQPGHGGLPIITIDHLSVRACTRQGGAQATSPLQLVIKCKPVFMDLGSTQPLTNPNKLYAHPPRHAP